MLALALSVQKFHRDESIDFFLTRTGATDRASANELADVLGDLPLALEQAGAYVEQTGGSLSQYLSLFQTRHQELLQLETPPPGYEHTIATTWSISIQRLPGAAAALLNLCAYLAPDDIPRELVCQGAEHTLRRCRPIMVVEQKGNDAKFFGRQRDEAVRWLENVGAKRIEVLSGDWILGV